MESGRLVYNHPELREIEAKIQGILCESVLEPIEEGGGHDW